MSRLEKLFTLLETGSNPQTRKLAATQLGQVVKANPSDLFLVLEKIYVYLSNPSWQTRIAAAQGVECVLKSVEEWTPKVQKLEVKDENVDEEDKVLFLDNGDYTIDPGILNKLSFERFDVGLLLKKGEFLLSKDTQEFDVDVDSKPSDQRHQLNKKLGLDVASKLGLDTSNIFSNEDIRESERTQIEIDEVRQREKVEKKDEKASFLLSSRELNRLKRRTKVELKSKDDQESRIDSKRSKIEPEEPAVSLFTGEDWIDSACWPFQTFLDTLLKDMFAPKWERRHGAATAIRELIKHQGSTGGKMSGFSDEQNIIANQKWLVTVALRLVSVLALDKFGDFVSDQVIAPVRESTAQALGSILKFLDHDSALKLSNVLITLTGESGWECRHGGMLGIKYTLAVRLDITDSLLPIIYPTIFCGLKDESDDVVSVAASALIPVVSNLIVTMGSVVPSLCVHLWNSLLDLDDLTTSTHSVMQLLASIVATPTGLELSLKEIGTQLRELVPRLFPFLSHSSIQVRKAGLETLLVLSGSQTGEYWLPHCILDTLRHVYQRALLEHNTTCLEIVPKLWNSLCENTPLQPLLMAGCPWFGPWIHLISGSSNSPLDPAALINSADSDAVHYLGGKEILSIVDVLEKEKYIARARNLGAKLLGKLAAYIIKPVPGLVYTESMETPLQMLLSKVLIPQLGTNSAYQKLSISIIIIQWLEQTRLPNHFTTTDLALQLFRNLTICQTYSELLQQKNRLFSDASDFISTLRHYNYVVDDEISLNLSIPGIEEVVGPLTKMFLETSKIKPKATETVLERRIGVLNSLGEFKQAQKEAELLTLSMLASALSCLGPGALPDKLNPVLKPLMESIKKEKNEEFQQISIKGLVRVLESCLTREVSPIEKVVRNLCTFVCGNPEETPQVGRSQFGGSVHPNFGILSNYLKEREADKAIRSKASNKKQIEANAVILLTNDNINDDNEVLGLEIQCRGASLAIQELVKHFGDEIFKKIPTLEELSFQGVSKDCDADDLVNCLKILQVIVQVLPATFQDKMKSATADILKCVVSPHTVVRFAAAKCLTAVAKRMLYDTMNTVILDLIPLLDSSDVTDRQGVIETVYNLAENLTVNIVPYIVLLVVPVLGRMSDLNQDVRLLATNTFATLVKLMPLEGEVSDHTLMSDELIAKKDKEKYFLSQLLNSKSVENYELKITVRADLRSYQVEGINWLGFLNRYKLHGILCDDMGLGKTIQTISILANHHYVKSQSNIKGCQSLVVCPTTLGGHWLEEISKFVDGNVLNAFLYIGSMNLRTGWRSQIPKYNVIITSYDIVRNDIEFFASIQWSYLVLDEGHVIKNPKSKTSMAIKKLVSTHRLILSGTPIQNGVTELWSLFDFLMPGYLGTEKQFTHTYARPILSSRDGKCSLKEQEKGVMAMEALHRQTLPFILRRMKEDVLKDLPPKITQDYYCDLSPIQIQLYEDFSKSQQKETDEKDFQPSHVFQALQYLRKVCNHPKLVLTPEHPLYDNLLEEHLKGNYENILDIGHSAKLTALKQLLTDLGIDGGSSENSCVVSQHRALIFFQVKSMLDIVEKDLLQKHFPALTYLRLDGSVPAQLRHGLVTRFNSDPSIDLLLLTTSVGGLGLNLTGADTVIFVEHDWNPMKDLQAMDRAHRIGQKRVVNVYRLITRNTLEEKIMSLQKFKIHTARTVISSDNSCMDTMETGQVLDLFNLHKEEDKSNKNDTKGTSIRSLLESMPELWDDAQYEEEYDMSSYISNLKS